MTFDVTPAHDAIFSAILDGSQNMQVEAVAGSGKTSTIVEAAKLIPRGESSMFIAFSKDVQLELAKRLPKRTKAKTLNALGLQVWSKFLRDNDIGSFVDVKSNKLYRLWSEMGKQGVYPHSHRKATAAVLKLARLAKANGIVIDDDPRRGLQPDTQKTWQRLISYYGVQLPRALDSLANAEAIEEVVISHTRTLLLASLEELTRIDFDDQLWLPFVFSAESVQFDRLFVDECQDLSPLNHELVARTLKPGGRLVSVGDTNQAIFGFRGADAASMSTLAARFQTKAFPLHVTYRCPRAVVDLAKHIVPHIEARDGAPEGLVGPKPIHVEEAVSKALLRPGDFVLSRTNAPAIAVAQALMKSRVAIEVLGRDLPGELKALVDGLGYSDELRGYVALSEFLANVDQWETESVVRANEVNLSESAVLSLRDKAETLRVLAKDVLTVKQVQQTVDEIFKKPQGLAVRISTVHKSKGLEADRIWILNPHLIPHPKAEQDWELVQEQNLKYIAITRAKQELRYLTSENA